MYSPSVHSPLCGMHLFKLHSNVWHRLQTGQKKSKNKVRKTLNMNKNVWLLRQLLVAYLLEPLLPSCPYIVTILSGSLIDCIPFKI